MRLRRFHVLLAVVVVFALTAAACGDGDGADTTAGEPTATTAGEPTGTTAAPVEPVTLRVLVHQNPPFTEFMRQFNGEFEAANPGVTVDMEIVAPDEMATAIQTRLTANDVDVIDFCAPPCAAFSNPIQPYMSGVTPPIWQQLIDAGLILDITDQPFVANYDEAAIRDAGSYNGRVYAVNVGRVSYSGMFVNNDLLADVGVSIPTTWGELVAACDAVQAADYECMTLGGADGWPVFVGAYGLLGAFYPDQAGLVEGLWTGDIKWNDENTLELWRRYQVFANDMLEEGVTALSHDAGPARYAAGDVAFMPTGVWQAPALEDAGPDFDWTYIPFPGSDDPADNQYLFGKYDMSWMIAANTPNQAAALAYVAAFSEPDNYQEFVNAVGFLPTQPTATLDSQLGEAVAPLLSNYRVGFEQYWVQPTGAGQWANGSQGAAWFAPFNVWEDPVELANQAQADLEAGLGS